MRLITIAILSSLTCLSTFGQSTSTQDTIADTTLHPASSFDGNVYTQMLLVVIQTDSDGESAIKSALIQVRILGLSIILAIVTLARQFRKDKFGWALGTVTVLITFLMIYDFWNSDVLYSYQHRSECAVWQLDSIRTHGAGITESMQIPKMPEHNFFNKMVGGFTLVGIGWYVGAWLIAWWIIYNRDKIFMPPEVTR